MRRPQNLFLLLVTLLILVLPCSGQDHRAAPSADPEIIVPAGTVIPIALSAYLNTRSTQVGDAFYADTLYPLWIQQRLVIPKGSTIKGTVTEIERPGRIRGRGRMALQLETIILPNGVTRELIAAFKSIHGGGTEKFDRTSEKVEGSGTTGADAGRVAGTAAQGAVIGAIVDRGATGAAIGAGIGGAAGLATVLLSRDRDLVLPPGTQFDIEMKQPIRFAYAELQFSPGELDSAGRAPAIRSRPPRDPYQHRHFLSAGRISPRARLFPWQR